MSGSFRMCGMNTIAILTNVEKCKNKTDKWINLLFQFFFWQSSKLQTNECDLFLPQNILKYVHKYLTQSLIDSMKQEISKNYILNFIYKMI